MCEPMNGIVSTNRAKTIFKYLVPIAIATVLNLIAVTAAAKITLSKRLLAIQPIGAVTELVANDAQWENIPYLLLCALFFLVGLASFVVLSLLAMFGRRASTWRMCVTVMAVTANCAFWPIGCRQAMTKEYAARTQAFRAVAQRAAPLVAALDQYKVHEGVCPPTLDALMPRYINAIPDTNLAAYPQFEYRVENAEKCHLYVNCPVGPGISFDTFYYAPERDEGNKPNAEHLERIDDWIYLHE